MKASQMPPLSSFRGPMMEVSHRNPERAGGRATSPPPGEKRPRGVQVSAPLIQGAKGLEGCCLASGCCPAYPQGAMRERWKTPSIVTPVGPLLRILKNQVA